MQVSIINSESHTITTMTLRGVVTANPHYLCSNCC